MPYCSTEDVFEVTGMNSTIAEDLSGEQKATITKMITKFIDRADQKIRRKLGIPITIRKEYHEFEYNETVELGPHEDELEFFGGYDPEDCVEAVYAIYIGGKRIKLPYPKDCDKLTEDIDDFTGTNATITREMSTVKCGDASIKVVFSAAGSFYFPSSANLKKMIESWTYVSFWFRTDDKTASFTIRLYDKDGNYEYHTFTLEHNDTWEIVSLKIDNFTPASSAIDWGSTELQKIEIVSDKACTVYFDNFNFNDGYFWTYPQGLICWADPDGTPWGTFEVTYSYDPYKVNTPEDLKEASACLAGIMFIDWLLGLRQRELGFQQMQDTLDVRPDRETFEITKSRLRKRAQDALAGIGYKTYEGAGIG